VTRASISTIEYRDENRAIQLVQPSGSDLSLNQSTDMMARC
jgi:hypothetical protein